MLEQEVTVVLLMMKSESDHQHHHVIHGLIDHVNESKEIVYSLDFLSIIHFLYFDIINNAFRFHQIE